MTLKCPNDSTHDDFYQVVTEYGMCRCEKRGVIQIINEDGEVLDDDYGNADEEIYDFIMGGWEITSPPECNTCGATAIDDEEEDYEPPEPPYQTKIQKTKQEILGGKTK